MTRYSPALLALALMASGCATTPPLQKTTSHLPSQTTNWRTTRISLNADRGIDWLRKVVNEPLPEKRPALGVQIRYQKEPEGLLIESVTPESPAEAAGLLKGDVITAYDGRKVDSLASFIQYISSRRESVSLAFSRGARSHTVKALPKRTRLGATTLKLPQWKQAGSTPLMLSQGTHVVLLLDRSLDMGATCVVQVDNDRANETVAINGLSHDLVRRANEGEVFTLSNDSLSGGSSVRLYLGARQNPWATQVAPPNAAVATDFPEGFKVRTPQGQRFKVRTPQGQMLENSVLHTAQQGAEITFWAISPNGEQYAGVMKIGNLDYVDVVGQHKIDITSADIAKMSEGARLSWSVTGGSGNTVATLAMERN